MRSSCAVCSLAVMLCLVVCVSANAKVTKDEAMASVADAKRTVKTVCDKAQKELKDAKSLLEKVEASKSEAAQASSHAEKESKDNTKAEEVANPIKSLLDAVDKLYQDAKGKLETAVNSLNTLLAEAQKLDREPDIQITPNGDPADDYTETNGKAATLKGNAESLDRRITTAVSLYAGVDATAKEMERKAKEAQLKNSHVSAIVAVAKIDTMLGNADKIIPQVEEKRNEVSRIVEEMKAIQTNPTTVPDASINLLLQNADNELTAAKDAVDNAKIARTDIQTQKDTANAALTKVKAENQEVSDAQNEASTAETCVRTAQQIVPKLNTALLTATNSVTNANDLKEKLKTALSKATSATRPEQSLTTSRLKPLQDSVSADVKAIQTMMGEADSILQKTENHKQTVHDIVQGMQTLKTTAKIESNNINELCKNAEGELTIVTRAVEKVKTEKEAMRQEKLIADAALTEVNAATEIDKAQQQADTATSCLAKVKENLAQLRIALQTAENSVAKVNDLKQQLKTVLSTTTTAPRTKEVKETVKADPPVGEGTEPDQKDTTVQPTSKDSHNQGDNSVEEIKDALITGAQNVPTTALTGEKAPAPGANNDSAMTVSVPLLVALIASAVLQ